MVDQRRRRRLAFTAIDPGGLADADGIRCCDSDPHRRSRTVSVRGTGAARSGTGRCHRCRDRRSRGDRELRLPKVHPGDSLELKMTPMIDVVFLLLVFFVWTSSFELPEFDLPSAIAETPTGATERRDDQPPPTEAFDEIVIRLSLADAQFDHRAEWTTCWRNRGTEKAAGIDHCPWRATARDR